MKDFSELIKMEGFSKRIKFQLWKSKWNEHEQVKKRIKEWKYKRWTFALKKIKRWVQKE